MTYSLDYVDDWIYVCCMHIFYFEYATKQSKDDNIKQTMYKQNPK